jgi:hypothetical protein
MFSGVLEGGMMWIGALSDREIAWRWAPTARRVGL